MGPNYLFLATEWADVAGSELGSLALISEDGRHRSMRNARSCRRTPTPFVAEVVYPLLERGAAALDERALSEALRTFLVELAPLLGESRHRATH